jgi:hypothetical protein
MAICRNAPFARAQMLIVLFFLSSCGFAYRPTAGGTPGNKMIYSIPLEGHALDITAGVANKKDTGAFDVMVWIRHVGSKDSLRINWMKLGLIGRKRDTQPYVLKEILLFKEGDRGKPVRLFNDTTITGLDLDVGTYRLDYHFAGVKKRRVGHALQIGITGSFTQAGKTREVEQAIGFKRFFWFDIAGN